MNRKMSDEELNDFLSKVARCEMYEKKEGNIAKGFDKGLRSSLHALGYDHDWVETTFRDKYEGFISTTNHNDLKR